ncbi:MAG: DNA polymerase III subunit gamma/tau [Solirubrobacterales bacterium]|nr:DNA polymerase III subunit gamma/tau [Solirubrobacterales bacterium]HMT05856.1 DNA polymerase III subunit gamma/tau [Solirubrobacterales bacterium]
MSESTSLYRRHRPHSFDQVVGQQHVVRTLSNAITQDKVHHAYLFVGSRGTGKTSMAKILAASLNCANGGPTLTPCGTCESCRTIAAGNSVDVIEMDAASNRSVDDIRELRDRVAYAPTAGSWKVYILDEAHMLTKEAWNAFLKTLEEPPPNTVFILATTEAHKVMPTIADRCQRFDFQRPSIEQLSEVLRRVSEAEQITIEGPAISMISRSASGSFRDALGTLDQLVSFSGSEISLDSVLEVLGAADSDLLFGVVDKVIEGDTAGVLGLVEQVARSGRDPARFARDLLGHLRVLLVTRTTGEIPEAFAVTASDPDRLVRQAKAIGPANLIRTIDELADALRLIRDGDEARLAVEVALLKAARPDFDPSSEGLARRLERLEQGVPPEPPTPPAATAGEDSRPPGEPSPEPGHAPDIESAPVQDAPAADGPEPFDLDRLQQVWPAVLDSLGAAVSGMVASYFDGTRPVGLDESKLTVGFPADAGFNRRNAERTECRQQMADAVQSVTGDRYAIEYTSLESGVPAPEPESEVMDEQDFVARVKSDFNAEEVI